MTKEQLKDLTSDIRSLLPHPFTHVMACMEDIAEELEGTLPVAAEHVRRYRYDAAISAIQEHLVTL
jgi:hypothetical protein